MHISVENALAIFPFSEGKLVAGKSGISRVLKAVNIIDAPDFVQWAKEGDMFFTTAYLFKDRVEDAIQIMRNLHQRQSAGLGIKLGRFWSEMPSELIEEADKLGFPLIELPYPFAFSDQINGLLQAEITRSTDLLNDVVDKQKRLMNVALHQTVGDNPFERISSVIEYPMAVVGGRGHILYNDTPCSEGELMSDWPWEPGTRKVYRAGIQLFRIPLVHWNDTIGFALFALTDRQLDKTEEGLFQQAAQMLAYYLGRMIENGANSFLHQELGSMITRYLEVGTPIETVLKHAEKAGVRVLERRFAAVLCTIPEGADLAVPRLEAIRQEMEFNPLIRDKKGYHVLTRSGILSIYPVLGNGVTQEIATLLQTTFPTKASGSPVFAFSTIKDQPERLSEAFEECKETLKLSDRLQVRGRVLHYDTIQFASLFQYVPEERMRHYCSQILGPLTEAGSVYSQDMLLTLDAYVANDGNLTETAKQLFVHRNTIGYRLEKMSELLSIDFKKPSDYQKVQLAVLFIRMMGK
jgi:purine catabolism regulator